MALTSLKHSLLEELFIIEIFNNEIHKKFFPTKVDNDIMNCMHSPYSFNNYP